MEKLVTKLNLPKEMIKEILEYLYYTPQQIELREMYKKVHFYIKSSIYSTNCEGVYVFSHRHKTMFICFCIKCGNYKYADLDDRVICKC